MPTNILTRRAALLSLGAFAAAGLGGCNTTPTAAVQPGAAAPAGLRIGAVNVDTAPLVAYVGNPTAQWAQQAMPGALAQAFAEVGHPGAVVSVTIDYVMLGSGPSGGFGIPVQNQDQMIGEVTIDGVAHPLRANSTYYPMAVDQPLFEQSNFDRIVKLSQAFAYWAARGYWGT